MSGQSFKQVVEELDDPREEPVVYRFKGNMRARGPRMLRNARRPRRLLPSGYFVERKTHGAYKLTVVDGVVV